MGPSVYDTQEARAAAGKGSRAAAAIDFNVATILKNPRAHTTSVLKEESTASKVAAKSHYRSFGPEFHRVLFNFGGQSPLILYYLKMHETGGISVTHNKKGSKFTKILREPYPSYSASKQSVSKALETADLLSQLLISQSCCSLASEDGGMIRCRKAGSVCTEITESPEKGSHLPFPNTHNWKSSLDCKPSTPPATTYYEIIKEAKRKFAKNQKDFRSIYVVIMESDDCQGLEWVGSLPVGYTPNVGRPGHRTTNWSIATLQEDLESSSAVHCGSGIWKWGGSWELTLNADGVLFIFYRAKQRIREDIKALKEQQEKIEKELDRFVSY
ncbi:hypothetical protein ACRRTK_013782 [Alexandromys fortis]